MTALRNVWLTVAATLLFVGPPFGPLQPPKKQPTPPKPTGPAKLKPATKAKPKCASIEVALPTLSPGVLLPALGDTDVMDNHELNVDVDILPTRGRLHLHTTVEVKGRHNGGIKPDVSTFFRRHDYRIVRPSLPSGCQIKSVSQAAGEIRQTRSGHEYSKAYGTGLIDYATCRTDSNGDDIGRLRCKEIVLRSATVELEPAETTCPDTVWVPVPDLTMQVNHDSGDREMGGNVVNLEVDAAATLSGGTEIRVRTNVSMEEAVPDHTTFSGTNGRTIFHVLFDYPGCRVTSISRDSGRVRSHRPGGEHEAYQVGKATGGKGNIVEGSLLNMVWCRSDSEGEDMGKIGCGTINYKSVQAKLAQW